MRKLFYFSGLSDFAMRTFKISASYLYSINRQEKGFKTTVQYEDITYNKYRNSIFLNQMKRLHVSTITDRQQHGSMLQGRWLYLWCCVQCLCGTKCCIQGHKKISIFYCKKKTKVKLYSELYHMERVYCSSFPEWPRLAVICESFLLNDTFRNGLYLGGDIFCQQFILSFTILKRKVLM